MFIKNILLIHCYFSKMMRFLRRRRLFYRFVGLSSVSLIISLIFLTTADSNSHPKHLGKETTRIKQRSPLQHQYPSMVLQAPLENSLCL
jgi:hypothetical protein